jgi:uncharacterized membrane protein
MKGANLLIKIGTYTALVGGLLMCLLAVYNSWSDHDMTVWQPLFELTLLSITVVYLVRGITHYRRRDRVSKWIRIGQLDWVVGFMFAGVLCTPVGHPVWVIETAHLLFTGLAIAAGYYGLLTYYDTKVGKGLSWIGFAVGIGGFLAAFVGRWYSVSIGELIAAIPLAMHVLIENRADVKKRAELDGLVDGAHRSYTGE